MACELAKKVMFSHSGRSYSHTKNPVSGSKEEENIVTLPSRVRERALTDIFVTGG
jgi:hypothetical protein